MKLPPDFRDLLEEFAREDVEYVVIGGYAYGFHAHLVDAGKLDKVRARGR
jgi:hypothetical protein